MDHDDPLWLWLLRGERDLDPDLVTQHQTKLRADLDRLESYLDDPPKRPNLKRWRCQFGKHRRAG